MRKRIGSRPPPRPSSSSSGDAWGRGRWCGHGSSAARRRSTTRSLSGTRGSRGQRHSASGLPRKERSTRSRWPSRLATPGSTRPRSPGSGRSGSSRGGSGSARPGCGRRFPFSSPGAVLRRPGVRSPGQPLVKGRGSSLDGGRRCHCPARPERRRTTLRGPRRGTTCSVISRPRSISVRRSSQVFRRSNQSCGVVLKDRASHNAASALTPHRPFRIIVTRRAGMRSAIDTMFRCMKCPNTL